jgi:hypothetical protein
MKFILLLITTLLIGSQTINAQNNQKLINPGLVFHTCKREVVVQKKAKVVIIDLGGKKVYGRVTQVNGSSFLVNSKKHPNITIKYAEISKLSLRKFGLPSRPYLKFLLDIAGFPEFTIWHLVTSKRFYFNQSKSNINKKKIELDYQVKEIPLKGLRYGKSILCD